MKLKKYLNSKNISKILALGILLSNIPINSFASILSDDGRYETFEDNNITINNILEEDKVDVEIKGNTLMNILENVEWGVRDTYLYNNSLKYNISGKTLTIINFADKDIDLSLNSGNVEKFDGVHSREMTIPKKSFIVEKIPSDECFRTFVAHTSSGWVQNSDSKNLMSKLVVLDGDYAGRLLPEKYFEGIKSVGQNNEEGYSLEVISSNKNLFDINKWVNVKYGAYQPFNGIDYKNRTVTVEGAISDTYTLTGATGSTNVSSDEKTFLIKVEPNVYCTLSFIKDGQYTGSNYIQQYDKDYNSLGVMAIGNRISDVNCVKTFITNSKTKYLGIRFGIQSIGNSITYSNIQLELSSNVTNYEPNKENKKYIKLKEPLRSLPNGIRDRIIKRNGQWVVERNCGEDIIDGTGYLSIHDNNSDTYIRYRIGLPKKAKNSGSSSVIERAEYGADKINVINTTAPGAGYPSNESGLYSGSAYVDSNPVCYISIKRTNLITPDIAGFASWLKQNNIKIVYQLSSPTYEPLNIESTMHLYLDTTHISTNSTIPANLKVTVDRVANRAKEYSELAKENPTIENISLSRMWTNLMRESILKDEFQDNINSVTEVSDMVLERKTASANLDLYIKCENLLSMSLNTNSISFEDFSGVEDMTKDSAVNIYINSSLPYKLNAYLPTEIQNSDKSNTMNLDILSIKDNSEINYQKFSAINNKLILKSNCESGNNKQHNIDLKLNGSISHAKDVYKTTIKFEAEQI